jgi:hypothetical protein
VHPRLFREQFRRRLRFAFSSFFRTLNRSEMGIQSGRFKGRRKVYLRDQVSESVAEEGLLDFRNGATVELSKERHGEFLGCQSNLL